LPMIDHVMALGRPSPLYEFARVMANCKRHFRVLAFAVAIWIQCSTVQYICILEQKYILYCTVQYVTMNSVIVHCIKGKRSALLRSHIPLSIILKSQYMHLLSTVPPHWQDVVQCLSHLLSSEKRPHCHCYGPHLATV